MELVQDMTKKCVCTAKDLKTTSKSIAVMKHMRVGGWVKKAVVFPLKTIYKLGTDVKRGEQVGVFGVKKTTIQ